MSEIPGMHPRMAMALGLAPDTRNERERFDDEMELRAMAVKYEVRWW